MEGNAQQIRTGLAVFEPLRQDTKSESLDARDRLSSRLAVGHDAREVRDLRKPAAVVLSLNLNDEVQYPQLRSRKSLAEGAGFEPATRLPE